MKMKVPQQPQPANVLAGSSLFCARQTKGVSKTAIRDSRNSFIEDFIGPRTSLNEVIGTQWYGKRFGLSRMGS
jgi:hypothetical protein